MERPRRRKRGRRNEDGPRVGEIKNRLKDVLRTGAERVEVKKGETLRKVRRVSS